MRWSRAGKIASRLHKEQGWSSGSTRRAGTQHSQKIFNRQEPLHLHKTLLYLYCDKLEALKCTELEIVLTYSRMFSYDWYQGARPLYCISKNFI